MNVTTGCFPNVLVCVPYCFSSSPPLIKADDLQKSSMIGVFFSMLSDVRQFYEYNNRETLMHQDDNEWKQQSIRVCKQLFRSCGSAAANHHQTTVSGSCFRFICSSYLRSWYQGLLYTNEQIQACRLTPSCWLFWLYSFVGLRGVPTFLTFSAASCYVQSSDEKALD